MSAVKKLMDQAEEALGKEMNGNSAQSTALKGIGYALLAIAQTQHAANLNRYGEENSD